MVKYLYKLSTGEKLRDYCKTHDISYSTAYDYILKGFSVDDSVEYAKKVKNTRKRYPDCYVYGNESLHEHFKNNKNAYTAITRHLREKELTVEQAVNLYEKNKKLKKPYNVKKVINLETGEIFNTIKECAKNINTLPSTLCKNLKKHWKTKGYEIVYYKE